MFHYFRAKPPYRTLNQITLSTSALQNNYTFFKNLNTHVKIAPVLKSNAYSHGLIPIARMADRFGAPFFIVDSLYEAYEVSKATVRTPILIMGYTHPDNFRWKQLRFHTVVSDMDTIRILQKYQPSMPLHLKVDTGMNRQGVRFDELEKVLEELKKFPRLNFAGITTHLADADNSTSQTLTKLQVKRFEDAIKMTEKFGFNPQWRHLANTAGSIKASSSLCNLARVGLGFYGISPLDPQDRAFAESHAEHLQPVLQLETTLSQIKKAYAGETIGYNGTFLVKENMTLGILPIGFYDGPDRRLSNTGSVLINDTVCPIVGRVSMNITVIDISHVRNVEVGQRCIVYSRNPNDLNSIQNSAKLCKTTSYDLLVHLAESIKRTPV
mgnify:CR=1 FL=1